MSAFDTISNPDLADEIVARIPFLTEENLNKLSTIVTEMHLRQDICHLVNEGGFEFYDLLEIKSAIQGKHESAVVAGVERALAYDSPTRGMALNARYEIVSVKK